MEKFELKVVGLTCATAVAALTAVAAYVIEFRQRPVGGPEEWGQLGDYLGGLINPVVGIVTVVLVVMTLRTTRNEAREARAQIAKQLEYMDRQAVLTDMHKRLEGVMADWERIMERRAPREFLSFSVSGGTTVVSQKTVRDVFEDSDLRHKMVEMARVGPEAGRSGDGRFAVFKIELIPLIGELDEYCLQYDAASNTRHLTYFYRNRVKRAVEMLSLAGVMQESVGERFTNNRQP